MANKISNKDKKKIKIILFVIFLCISLGSLIYLKVTTPPTLESVMQNIDIDTTSINIELTITNKNEEIKFTCTVSDDDNYIKTVKESNDVSETNIVYKENDKYYLYQKKDDEKIVELNEIDAKNFIDKLKLEVIELEDYLDVDYDAVKYYFYSKDLVTYSNYRNNIFYDNELVFENNQLIEIKQTFTSNNLINTVSLKYSNNVNVEIPKIL